MRPFAFRSLLLLAAFAPALRAEPFAAPDWRLRARVTVTQAGPVRLPLSVEILDATRPDFTDLRLVDPRGREVPLIVEQTRPAQPVVRAPKSLSSRVEDAATVFELETGVDDPITALQIDAGGQRFLTRALVESSHDGATWQLLGRNLPVYDRGGPLRALELPIPAGVYPRLRVALERLGGAHVVLRNILLVSQRTPTEPAETLAVRVASREESSDETRLTLALPAAHLFLAALELRTPERVFDRRVRLVRRIYENDVIREETFAGGTLVRTDAPERPESGPLRLTLEAQVPERELTLVIENGDSPPLAIDAVAALRRPAFALFDAPAAATFALYTGNSQAAAPRYDVGSLASGPAGFQPALATPGPLEPNPDFRPRETLPEIPALGAPLDVTDWGFRRPVRVAAPGIQQLELDPPVLSRAQRGLADLRLLGAGRQVPFVVEHTSLTRSLTISPALEPDASQPRLSRWRLTLPYPRLPLTRMTAVVATPLFQRDLRVFENIEDDRGYRAQRWLGHATWSQTPGRSSSTFAVALDQPPATDTVWLETDNGDNPPISLTGVRVQYDVTRLLFKAGPDTPVFLYYGNAQSAAPRYDLSLVGAQLLAAEKIVPTLGAEERMTGSSFAQTLALAGKSGWLFWGMLGLVVAVLLAVIARLLPKTPAPDHPADPPRPQG